MQNMFLAAMLITTSLGLDMNPKMCDFSIVGNVHQKLKEINSEFKQAIPGKDNWDGFIPLLEFAIKYQAPTNNPRVATRIESEILEHFTSYAFACEYDYDLIKANFDSRLACIDFVCQFDLVGTDTNAVMSIADWIAGAKLLALDEETLTREGEEAILKDRITLYGGKRPPRIPASLSIKAPLANLHLSPPNSRRYAERIIFRKQYNSNLPDFRAKAEARMRKFVFEEFKAKDEQERKALWAEFCRRAKFAAK